MLQPRTGIPVRGCCYVKRAPGRGRKEFRLSGGFALREGRDQPA